MRTIVRWGALPLLVLVATACSEENAVTGPATGIESATVQLAGVTAGETTSATLLAGQDMPVGTVNVTHNGATVTIEYVLNPGVCMTETHWEANYDQNNLTNRGGNPQVGRFAFGDDELNCVSSYTETGAIQGSDDGGYVVAAHAVVQGDGAGGNPHVVFGTYDDVADGAEEGDIYGINPTTGDLTLIADIPNDGDGDPFDPNGLALDRDAEELFFVSEGDLYRIPADGSAAPTSVASDLGGGGPIRNATIDGDFYYYIPNGTGEIWRVGTDGTGNAQYCDLGAPGALYFGDIAADPEGGIIYGVARVDDANAGEAVFFTVDVEGADACATTNSATFVTPTTYGFNLQLAFGDDGTLYGQQAVSEPSADEPGQWYVLDPVTGEITSTLTQTTRSFTDIAGGLPFKVDLGEETAWADGDRFTRRGNWATFMGPFELE